MMALMPESTTPPPQYTPESVAAPNSVQRADGQGGTKWVQPSTGRGSDGESRDWKEFITHNLWKYVGTLVMDRDPATGQRSVSFLSLSLLLLMAQSQLIWHRGADIPATMMQVLIAMLGAKLGHRGVAVFQEYVQAKKEGAQNGPAT